MTVSRPLLILPTFNEAGTIREVISRSFGSAPGLNVLVVDDGSTDGTSELISQLCQDNNSVHLLQRESKQGLGDAYRAGFGWGLTGGYDVLIEMDADLQHDPADLHRLLASITSGSDLAIGSRYVDGGQIPQWNIVRRLISRGGNRLARTLLRLGVQDSTSGMRAYRSSLLQSVGWSATTSQGYAFQVEMTFITDRYGATISEIPITFADRDRGDSKMSLGIAMEAVALLVRLMWRRPPPGLADE